MRARNSRHRWRTTATGCWWNGTPPTRTTRGHVHPPALRAQARRTPDAIALVYGDRELTYRELDARADELARHLQGLGVGPDVLVGICMHRSSS